MRIAFLIFILITCLTGCARDLESPLILPVGSEPSAKLHNDSGIAHFQARRYEDALLRFMQAYAADKTTGEIYFNIALAYHHRGDSKKATEFFILAEKYASGNDQITQSPLFKKYVPREGEKGIKKP